MLEEAGICFWGNMERIRTAVIGIKAVGSSRGISCLREVTKAYKHVVVSIEEGGDTLRGSRYS